ncbi:MAG: hypothetical protein MHMPM18_002579 [Marteilia pararefringens]
MENMKKLVYNLQVENHQLKENLRKRTEQNILENSTVTESDTDEFNEFKKNQDDHDKTERFNDTLLSSNNPNLGKLIRDNTALQESLTKLNAEYLIIENKLSESLACNSELRQESEALKKSIELSGDYKLLYECIRSECDLPQDSHIPHETLVEAFKDKYKQLHSAELSNSFDLCKELESIIHDIVNFIENLYLDRKSEVNGEKIEAIVKILVDKINNISSKCPSLDPGKIAEILERIVTETLSTKSLTQHPISELVADVTEIHQTKPNVTLNNQETMRNCSDFAAISTPCIKIKRVEELKTSFANVSSELFKSVSNMRTELCLEPTIMSAQSTRLSGAAFAQNQSLSANCDQSTMNNTTNFFDKSDANMARVNQFIVKLEKLCDQNNELQGEMIEYIDSNKNLQEAIALQEAQSKEKEDKIVELNEMITEIESNNKSINAILFSVQEILQSQDTNCIVSDLENIVEEYNNLQSAYESMCQGVDDLHIKIETLETNANEKDENIMRLKADIEVLSQQISDYNNKPFDVSLKDDKEMSKDCLKNNLLSESLISNLNRLPEDPIQWNDLKSQIVSLLDQAEPLYNLNVEALRVIKLKMGDKQQTSILSNNDASLANEKSEAKKELADDEEIALVEQNAILVEDLRNQILLLENEVNEGNNKIELLKIARLVPEKVADNPQMDELLKHMNALQSLLDKSYVNNKILRDYLKTLSGSDPKRGNFSVNSATSSSLNQNIANKQRVFGQHEMSQMEQTVHDSLAILTNLAKHIKTVHAMTAEGGVANELSRKEMSSNIHKCKKAMKVMQRKLLAIYRFIIYEDAATIDKSSPNRGTIQEETNENFDPEAFHSKHQKSFEKLKGKTRDMVNFFEKNE